MKKLKINIYIILIVTATLVLTSCSSEHVEPELEPYFTPVPEQIVDTTNFPVINMVLVSEDYVMENWTIIEELYKVAGVKANFKTVRPQNWQDAVSKIIASDENYDFFEIDSANAEIYRNKFLTINDFAADAAPNYFEWAMSVPSFADDYNAGIPIVRFPFREDSQLVTANAFAAPGGAAQRVYNLESFYNYMGDNQMVIKGSTMELVELFAPYFGTNTYWYFNKVSYIYGPVSEEFKIMLKELSKMYSLGIIPSDYELAPPSTFTKKVLDGTASLALAEEGDYEWLYENNFRPVMLQFNENAYVPSRGDEPTKYGAITYGNGNEYNTLAFLDACFSDEGRELLNTGINGVHKSEHIDGAIEYMMPYTQSGSYQWKYQGLTPEGLPGVYYNSWAKFDEDLLKELSSTRMYLPDEDFIIDKDLIDYKYGYPKRTTKASIEQLQYDWWTAFITGEKDVDTEWTTYVSELNRAGCYHGYLE